MKEKPYKRTAEDMKFAEGLMTTVNIAGTGYSTDFKNHELTYVQIQLLERHYPKQCPVTQLRTEKTLAQLNRKVNVPILRQKPGRKRIY